jgi:DNA-binding NarL/FixJ family response regulator
VNDAPVNDAPAGGRAPSVLLVDDTPDLRALVRMALERRGDFQVVAEAGDGLQGVDAAEEHQPDVVLLDIAMPVMSGLEALPLIRRVCPTSTVIMLSGFGADKMAAQALAAGADGYIQKGQPIRVLLAQVHALVESSRRPGILGPGPDQRRGEAPGTSRPSFGWRLSPRPAV